MNTRDVRRREDVFARSSDRYDTEAGAKNREGANLQMKERARFAMTAPLPHPERSRSPTKSTSRSNRFFQSHSDTDDTADDRQQKQREIETFDDAPSPPIDKTRRRQRESPDAWFQRIMKAKQLSPLDLCDLFSYGDARRHPVVPLSHVCEVVYDLDPEVAASGYDPMTPEMEGFLYQFSFGEAAGDLDDGVDGDGEEIVVSVKEALRSLDIWKSGVASPAKNSKSTAKSASHGADTQRKADPIQRTSRPSSPTSTKSVLLATKNKQLQGVISSLQDANVRLSQQLGDAMQHHHHHHRHELNASATSQQQTNSSSSLTSSFLRSSSASPVTAPRPHSASAIVNQHEDALVRIANRLQYAGVKQLEELLLQCDASSSTALEAPPSTSPPPATPSGFVTLKQLRWLLSEHFQVAISETELMESCLGMSFSAQARLDYREFVHVLLDVLVYAFPTASAPRKQQLYDRIREYVASDFSSTHHCDDRSADAAKRERRRHREMLVRLCEKYDLEGDERISVAEIMRVLYSDLPKLHAGNLPFPLTQQDALLVVQPFVREVEATESRRGVHAGALASGSKRTSGFLSYPELLDALFADPETDGVVGAGNAAAETHPALEWAFWTKLRNALCGGHLALEPKVHAQLCQIFRKLDPTPRRFLVSKRTFARILDQHVGPDELDALSTALAHPMSSTTSTSSGSSKDRPSPGDGDQQPPPSTSSDLLRFDVFMKLVFGAPALQDAAFLRRSVVAKLVQNELPIREGVAELLKTRGGGWEVAPAALFSLLACRLAVSKQSSAEQQPAPSRALSIVETLYLFAVLDDDHVGRVELKTLWTFLRDECWSDSSMQQIGDTDDRSGAARRASATLESTRRVLVRCMDAYDLERALARHAAERGGRVSQDHVLQEIDRMLATLGRDAHRSDELDPASLQQLVAAIAVQTNDVDSDLVRSGRLHLPVALDALFDALFDWDAVAAAMGLPHRLVDVKRALELFDWQKDGSVALADWSRAWRVVCPQSGRRLADWELRVLQRRFSAASGRRGRRARAEGIDYARLLVHLMDTQHERARQRLKAAVVAHFRRLSARVCRRRAGGGASLSAQDADKLFRQIDASGKGHINLRDLQTYLASALAGGDDDLNRAKQQRCSSDDSSSGGVTGDDVQNVNAVAHVLGFLASSGPSDDGEDPQRSKPTTVSRARFLAFLQSLAEQAVPKRSVRTTATRSEGDDDATRSPHATRSFKLDGDFVHASCDDHHDDLDDDSSASPVRRPSAPPQVVTNLRQLELAILDVCSAVAGAGASDAIFPTRAFRYLSDGVARTTGLRSQLPRSRSASPARHRRPDASSLSMTSRSPRREVAAATLAPIAPSTLQRVLLAKHALQVSKLLVTQFFEHIGAAHVLELLPFARWVAPLTVAMENKVREMVRKMALRSKGGGGKVELDRFLGQLHRKLLDSPVYAAASRAGSDDDDGDEGDGSRRVRCVPPSLLLSKLHLLNVPMTRGDMETLRRHVGMEESADVDFALFLQRIYEVSARLATRG